MDKGLIDWRRSRCVWSSRVCLMRKRRRVMMSMVQMMVSRVVLVRCRCRLLSNEMRYRAWSLPFTFPRHFRVRSMMCVTLT